ncbi:50S ribosomal protein L1 [Candidatus Saccharibacteria bacterium]|nr:50S ribosomal protein L1 [Candidatus Saccharibacteria bacterium]
MAKEDQPTVVEEKKTAKAGKRSEKSLKEAAEKQEKEDRKANKKEIEAPKSKPTPKTRSILERRGKKFREVAKLVEKDKEYSLKEALALVTKTNPSKFDATVELHIRLNVDPRHADQNIRGNLVLPAGTGKSVRVAVFADTDDAAKAKKAGAEIAGIEEVTKDLDKGVINFDVLVAVPTQMAKLGKYARLLGPRGLMPNPKSGTVTPNVVKAVEEAKAGRIEFRVDSTGIVHLGIGKISFGDSKLIDNAKAVIASVKSAKPNSVKGNYVRSAFVASSMGPGIKIVTSDIN